MFARLLRIVNEAAARLIGTRAGGDKIAAELCLVSGVPPDRAQFIRTVSKLALGAILAISARFRIRTTDLSLVKFILNTRSRLIWWRDCAHCQGRGRNLRRRRWRYRARAENWRADRPRGKIQSGGGSEGLRVYRLITRRRRRMERHEARRRVEKMTQG